MGNEFSEGLPREHVLQDGENGYGSTNKCPQNREEVALPLPPHALPFTPSIPWFDTPQGCLLRSAPIGADVSKTKLYEY